MFPLFKYMQLPIFSTADYLFIEVEKVKYLLTFSPLDGTPWSLLLLTPASDFEKSQASTKGLIGTIVPLTVLVIIGGIIAFIVVHRYRAKV